MLARVILLKDKIDIDKIDMRILSGIAVRPSSIFYCAPPKSLATYAEIAKENPDRKHRSKNYGHKR